MARYRITYFFTQDRQGWSESFHTTYTSPTAIAGLITNYTSMRRQFLSRGCSIIDVRVSDDATFRDLLLFPIGLPIDGSVGGSPSAPFCAALFRLAAGTQIFRSMFCRGLPSNLVNGDRLNTLAPSYPAAVAFKNFLSGPGIGISSKPLASTAVLETAFNAGTGVHTVSASLGTLTMNTPLVLTGVPRSIVAPRIWRVAESADGTHFTLQKWPTGVDVSGSAKWRLATPTVTSTTDCKLQGITERRVGRPFGLLRGRAAPIR